MNLKMNHFMFIFKCIYTTKWTCLSAFSCSFFIENEHHVFSFHGKWTFPCQKPRNLCNIEFDGVHFQLKMNSICSFLCLKWTSICSFYCENTLKYEHKMVHFHVHMNLKMHWICSFSCSFYVQMNMKMNIWMCIFMFISCSNELKNEHPPAVLQGTLYVRAKKTEIILCKTFGPFEFLKQKTTACHLWNCKHWLEPPSRF